MNKIRKDLLVGRKFKVISITDRFNNKLGSSMYKKPMALQLDGNNLVLKANDKFIDLITDIVSVSEIDLDTIEITNSEKIYTLEETHGVDKYDEYNFFQKMKYLYFHKKA